MSPILLYYLAGLTAALIVGIVCYYVVGFAAVPLWTALFGAESGPMWGRLFRMSVVMVALVGALSTKFYGCSGPTDYAHVARDHRQMLHLTSQQIAGSLDSAALYLIFVAAVGGLAFAVLRGWSGRVASGGRGVE